MLRFEEEDARLRADERVAARRSEPAPDRVAQLLRLQQGAGNQAVARWLLQREPMTGTSTPGSQTHHPGYAYAIGDGEAKPYHLDKWITKKQSKDAPSPVAYAGGLDPQVVAALIRDWDTSQTIFIAVNTAFVGTPAWSAPAAVGVPTTMAVDLEPEITSSQHGPEFARHFISLQENIALRENDMANNTPQTVTVVSKPKLGKPTTKAYSPNWHAVLATARTALKAKLQGNEAAPPRKEDIRLVDDVVLNGNDDALTSLRELNLIQNVKNEAKFKANSTSGTGGSRGTNAATIAPEGVEFNFGLNHLRFILYLEWRAMGELTGALPIVDNL